MANILNGSGKQGLPWISLIYRKRAFLLERLFAYFPEVNRCPFSGMSMYLISNLIRAFNQTFGNTLRYGSNIWTNMIFVKHGNLNSTVDFKSTKANFNLYF